MTSMPDGLSSRDRNWNELLQELRVTQTGLQILTGFLVTLPFHSRFEELSSGQVAGYLVVLATAVLATVLVLAPVNYHRVLFRQHEKEWLVLIGNRCARAGLIISALAVVGVVWLLFDFVTGHIGGLIAGLAAFAVFTGFWIGVPLVSRRHGVLAATPPTSAQEEARSPRT